MASNTTYSQLLDDGLDIRWDFMMDIRKLPLFDCGVSGEYETSGNKVVLHIYVEKDGKVTLKIDYILNGCEDLSAFRTFLKCIYCFFFINTFFFPFSSF